MASDKSPDMNNQNAAQSDTHARADIGVSSAAQGRVAGFNDPLKNLSVAQAQAALDPHLHLRMKDPYLGFVAPQSGLGKELGKIGAEFQEYRQNTIEALPRAMVNNSSNLIGVTQLVGEVMMFKAGGSKLYEGLKTAKDGKHSIDIFSGHFQDWLAESKHFKNLAFANNKGVGAHIVRFANPVLEPLHNILQNVKGSAGGNFNFKSLLRPQFYKESFQSLTNLGKATEVERARMGLDQFGKQRKIVNRWQNRATFAGMLAMTIAATMPDDKDSPEEVEKLTEMQVKSPAKYAAYRAATALNPLQWWDNKRAFTGFMMTLCGMSTFLAGFRNVGGNNAYFWNKAHGINGLITGAAGAQLFLAPTADQGWSRFGSTLWARMVFLPNSISKRYAKGDKDAHFYSAGQAAFQTANAEAFLFGGAEKLKDGTVVDHQVIRERAKAEAKREKLMERLEKRAQKEHVNVETLAANDTEFQAMAAQEAKKSTGDAALDQALIDGDRTRITHREQSTQKAEAHSANDTQKKPEKIVQADQLEHSAVASKNTAAAV